VLCGCNFSARAQPKRRASARGAAVCTGPLCRTAILQCCIAGLLQHCSTAALWHCRSAGLYEASSKTVATRRPLCSPLLGLGATQLAGLPTLGHSEAVQTNLLMIDETKWKAKGHLLFSSGRLSCAPTCSKATPPATISGLAELLADHHQLQTGRGHRKRATKWPTNDDSDPQTVGRRATPEAAAVLSLSLSRLLSVSGRRLAAAWPFRFQLQLPTRSPARQGGRALFVCRGPCATLVLLRATRSLPAALANKKWPRVHNLGRLHFVAGSIGGRRLSRRQGLRRGQLAAGLLQVRVAYGAAGDCVQWRRCARGNCARAARRPNPSDARGPLASQCATKIR